MKPSVFLLLVSTSAWAEPYEVSIDGLRHAWYVVPTGVDISLTSDPWKLVMGGGLEQPHFGRDLATGDQRPDTDPYLKPLQLNGELALLRTWKFDWADAWVGPQVVGYQFLAERSDAFPDWAGNVFWELEAGLKQDRRTRNDHGLEAGYVTEITADWSPSVLSLKGTDFYRAAVHAAWFVPLWDVPGDVQMFSGLLALRADAQYTGGAQVPIYRLESTKVRGYDNTFDARFLTAGSAELRMRLPSWWKSHDVVPVGFGFLDAGTYSGFADSTSEANRAGVLAGVGIGGGLELFGKATPTLTLGIPLVGSPLALWWDLSFQLAF